VQGIAPASADAYLESAGLERTLADGRLRLALTAEAHEEAGVTTAWLEAREMALEDSGELLGVREVALRDVVLNPAARKVRLGELVVSGPRIAFVRDPSRSLLALGMRRSAERGPAKPDTSAGEGAPPAQEPEAAAAPAAAPRAPVTFEIGRAAWLDSNLTFVDEAADPPASFAIDELGVELTGFALSSDPSAPQAPPAKLSGRLRAEGVAEELTWSGSVSSVPGSLSVQADLELAGHGLRGVLLAQYLRPMGITPLLESGELRLKAHAGLEADERGFVLSLGISDAELADGGVPLLGAEAVELEGVRQGADGLELERAAVRRPFARIGRDRSGDLVLGGVKVALSDEAETRKGPPTLPWLALPPIRAGEIAIEGARLALWDASLVPPVELELYCDAALRDLAPDGRRARSRSRSACPARSSASRWTAG
jgi:hypothetical protein